MQTVTDEPPRTEAPNGRDINVTRHVIEIYSLDPLISRDASSILLDAKPDTANPPIWGFGRRDWDQADYGRLAVLNASSADHDVLAFIFDVLASVGVSSSTLQQRSVIEDIALLHLTSDRLPALLTALDPGFVYDLARGRSKDEGIAAWAAWAEPTGMEMI